MTALRKETPAFTLEITHWQDSEADLKAVRRAVFIEEQQIPEVEEWDDEDAVCRHLLARIAGRAVGTGRLLADGKIGRMAVLAEARAGGLGSALLQRLLALARADGHREVYLHAQVTALSFYAAHGFIAEGTVFDECDIPHQRMRQALPPAALFVPHLTVAAIIERDGRYLMVEELVHDRAVFNQPAGHLEAHETLLDAVVREVREETGYRFVPEALVGLYQWPRADGETYLRVAFSGRVEGDTPGPLDADILRTLWLTPQEIAMAGQEHPSRLRTALVTQCLEDYRRGQTLPLEVCRTLRTQP